MWSWNGKLLVTEQGYLYTKNVPYVDNVSDILVMIFLSIIFQTSYEKCFIVKENIFDKADLYVNEILQF